ncbi:MAG: PH domain-containing protein [Candidatus Thorarchaeota archaeon]
MHEEQRGTVIKPPIDNISSGKIIKPSMRLLWKEFTGIFLTFSFFWLLGILAWIGFGYIIIVLDDGLAPALYWGSYIPTWWPYTYLYGAILIFVFVLPFCILYPLYFRNIEYSVISASGETMPEVYVKKGLLNITKKHVPFRTITNIASRAGPLDRLFGIGTVEIETAGYSGANQQGPEEKLEGLPFYEEVRDFVLQELRRYRHPYATATEIIPGVDEPIPDIPDSLDDEILKTLREIRDILKEKE